MSLSPYINPTNLNASLQTTNKVGQFLYPDSFDKRSSTGLSKLRSTAMDIVDTVKDVSDSIGNAVGTRSPMYTIGEIPRSLDGALGTITSASQYVPDQISGLVRAVSSAFFGNEQDGVIIDGLGKVDGKHSVEYTKNPAYFIGSNIIDQRYRQPSTLTMTVMVSNYLNDDITGTLLDSVSALDPTGLFGSVKNMIKYEGNTRAQYALYKLRWLMENAKPFTVYTPHGIYENMLIKSLNPTTDASKMDMLYCEIQFQEIIFCKPYSSTPGKIPARRGVAETARGWTPDAAKKLTTWSVSKTAGLFNSIGG